MAIDSYNLIAVLVNELVNILPGMNIYTIDCFYRFEQINYSYNSMRLL